jgi:hypothetical protein
MKNGARDLGAFVGSILGSMIIGAILWEQLKAPCQVDLNGQVLSIGQCVGNQGIEEFFKHAGEIGVVLGAILAFISELLPGKSTAD